MVVQTPTKEQKNEIRKLKKTLTRNKDGTVSSTIGNYVAILAGDPRLKGAIRLNELSGRAQIVRDLGWHRNPEEPVTDTDVNYLRLWIETEYGISSEKNLIAAMDVVANEWRYHPVRDKLNSLVHDGISRIPYVLHHFLGAEVNDINTAFVTVWLLEAIARVFHPGIKADLMLCLTGDQGAGKSSFFRLMAMKDEWFTDDVKRLDDENVCRKLAGHLIVELSEMNAVNRARIEEIKSFISRQYDTYKVPYDRHPRDVPRQCVFCGSANRKEFLPSDRSGNRRFMPIAIDPRKAEVHILEDEAASRAYCEQVWAEAMVIYRSGNWSLTLPKEIERQLDEYRQAFLPDDDRVGMVTGFLERTEAGSVCSRMIFREAFSEFRDPTQYELRDIAEIVNTEIDHGRLPGWRRYPSTRRYALYGQQRGWERIPQDPETFPDVTLPAGLFEDDPSSADPDPLTTTTTTRG